MTQTKRLPPKQYARAKKYESLLKMLRLNFHEYLENGKGAKAARVIARAKLIVTPLWVSNHNQGNNDGRSA